MPTLLSSQCAVFLTSTLLCDRMNVSCHYFCIIIFRSLHWYQLTALFISHMRSLTSQCAEMEQHLMWKFFSSLKWSVITVHAEIKIRGWRNNLRSAYLCHHFRLVLLLSFDVIIVLISLSSTLLSWSFPHFHVCSSRLFSLNVLCRHRVMLELLIQLFLKHTMS